MRIRKERVAKWAGIGILVLMAMLWAGHDRAKAAQSATGGEDERCPWLAHGESALIRWDGARETRCVIWIS